MGRPCCWRSQVGRRQASMDSLAAREQRPASSSGPSEQQESSSSKPEPSGSTNCRGVALGRCHTRGLCWLECGMARRWWQCDSLPLVVRRGQMQKGNCRGCVVLIHTLLRRSEASVSSCQPARASALRLLRESFANALRFLAQPLARARGRGRSF